MAEPDRSRARVLAIFAGLLAVNAVAWLWAFAAFAGQPVLLGMATLAYVFGLRHAVDADHIAAIDNVTRKLMRDGQKPVSVGLYFSFGHSTVVALACVVIALTSVALRDRFAPLRDVGAVIGTGVSALFLLLIALANVVTLLSIYRAFRANNGAAAGIAPQGGLLGRVLRPLTRFIAWPWHMYPLGFLFGLGFDTASEIGLLGISASQASLGGSIWSIMVFPALFTAGMSLVDTADGIVMTRAYGWAMDNPARKLAYNFAITLISVVVALLIGALEALNLIAGKLSLTGPAWRWLAEAGDHFGTLGCVIIAMLIACWAVSVLVYRHRRVSDFRFR